MLEGRATVTPTGAWASCRPVEIGAGDFVIFPDGMTSVWHVTEPILKHARKSQETQTEPQSAL